jgi:hypothetical protein
MEIPAKPIMKTKREMGRLMGRVKLPFARGLEIEFTDRCRAIKQIEEIAERGTRFPIVVYGPEGCGKTSWLLQAVEFFKEWGFGVIYFNPLRRMFEVEVGVKSLKQRALDVLRSSSSDYALAKLVWSIIDFAKEAIEHGRRKLAIIIDDVFQYIGARESSFTVKGLLELIEYPPKSYDVIAAIAATSEGASRMEIGRHLWAWLKPMWNMGESGFKELYEEILGDKPPIENVWRLTGGNPRVLAQLYESKWDVEFTIRSLAESKKLEIFISSLDSDERGWLLKAVEDPDTLLARERMPLLNRLVELNLIVDNIPARDERSWIDEPPPERNIELGVGRHVAWQTPIHREAVRRAIAQC